MPSKTFKGLIDGAVRFWGEKTRQDKALVLSLLKSVNAISSREWLLFNGQELRQLPAAFSVDAAGVLSLAPDAAEPVSITWPKVALSQEATLEHMMLEAAGIELSIIKEYPAQGEQAASTREFSGNQLPLITDNFAVKLTFQPGASFRKLGVLYGINV